MDWLKKNHRKILLIILLAVVLTGAFWYGGSSPSMHGWKNAESTAEQGSEAAASASTQETTEPAESSESAAEAATDSRPDGNMSGEEKVEAAKKIGKAEAVSITASETAKPAADDKTADSTEPQKETPDGDACTCTLSISCAAIQNHVDWLDAQKTDLVPENGWLLPPTEVVFYEGESVFNVLQRTCKEQGIQMEFADTPIYNSAYIEGIGNLYEFDCGELSGWAYSVNDWFPNYGCSRYQLQNGDTVAWAYTCDLGVDIGGYNALEGRERESQLKERQSNVDAFSDCHPALSLLYFVLVITFSMILMHPVCLAVSIASAFIYSIWLSGARAARINFLGLVPIALFAALVNPAFSHAGTTILTYLPSGNPLTLESILYGLAAGTMLASVLCWFGCCSRVMTSDKFVYLFGRIIPSLSLVLSMTLRFIPRFKAQAVVVSNAQHCVNWNGKRGGILRRAKEELTILSALVTWSLENAIETADSMKSRGYGLPGRTAFSIYHFDYRDCLLLTLLLFSGGYLTVGVCIHGLAWSYYPIAGGVLTAPYQITLYAAYLMLCLTPMTLDMAEDFRWKRTERENFS